MSNTTTTEKFRSRLDKLRGIIARAGLDAAALVPGSHLTYLTGVKYHLFERLHVFLIPAQGDPAMILPELEVPKIRDFPAYPIRLFDYSDSTGPAGAFEAACNALSLGHKLIGVEGFKMRFVEGMYLRKYAPGCHIESADDTLALLRIHKDASEIESLRTAIKVSETALVTILPKVRVGLTERQIANMLIVAMMDAGSSGEAFDPIVLSGPNSAKPHGTPTDRPIQQDEILLFDFGTLHNGYPSDITRTFSVGTLNAELSRVYEIVLAANEAGIRAAGPGVPAQEVDRAARKVITEAGYGEYFLHRTGHGLGPDGHEDPYMREGNAQPLEPGMVFTVEPGIYLAGKGGVRIEDDVLITKDGHEVLTRDAPKTVAEIEAIMARRSKHG
jgi:Xaa-Pro dipeptidase